MNRVGITKQIINKNVKTSCKGILVNKLSTSSRAMKWSGQKLETSSANENESCTENSLDVRGDKMGRNWGNY